MGRLIMIIVDTTVLIDIWRGQPKIKALIQKYHENPLFISAITIAELFDGLGYTKEKKGEVISNKIKKQIEKVITGFHIIPINNQVLQESGSFKGSLRARGIIIDIADCIIGLTVKLFNAEKLITRNQRHFKEFGINIESYDII